MVNITAGVTAIRATVELTQKLSDLISYPKIDVADVRAKVHEMLIHAVNAQSALAEAQNEILELRQQLDDRTRLEALRADMEVHKRGFLLRRSEKAQGLFNPHCPVCWGDSNKAIPLVGLMGGVHRCAIHEGVVYRISVEEKIV